MSCSELMTGQREHQIERIAADLLPRASQLTRLVLRRVSAPLSRTEGGLLRTLSEGPRRITELAELEGLAQPTATALVKRLEERGWATRAPDALDRRAAVISLTPDGATALEDYRRAYREALARRLQAMDDDELAELDAATAALGRVVEDLRSGGGR